MDGVTPTATKTREGVSPAMFRAAIYLVAFVTGAIVMGFEMLGSDFGVSEGRKAEGCRTPGPRPASAKCSKSGRSAVLWQAAARSGTAVAVL
jgi:hypothetical protein